MSIFNLPRCQTAENKNTAVPACNFDIKKIVGVVLAKSDFRITATNAADLPTLKAYLQAQCLLGNLYPIHHLVMNSDNSEDVSKSTDNYGNVEYVKDGSYDLSFFVKKGGACYNAILRSFNSAGFNAFLIDSDGNFIGTKTGTSMRPITSTIYVPKFKFANGTDPSRYNFNITMDRPEEINDAGKLMFFAGQDDNDVTIDYASEIVGNFDVVIGETAVAAGKATVSAKTLVGGIDLYDDFSAALAVVGAWVVTNHSTGAAITPSAVVVNAALKAWDISFTLTGDADISLASATALAALTPTAVGGGGEPGYTSNTETVTLPAP